MPLNDPSKAARAFPDTASVAMALTPGYPVYCIRPRVIAATARRFQTLFPGTVLYAVKCNPQPLVLDALYQGGIRHFDTASLPEIAQVCEAYPDAQAYFMHPVKGRAVIKAAYSVYGVRHYVIDHANELNKVLEETGGETSVGFVLKGPTCDSLDVLPSPVALPDDAREGDWIEIDQIGAYSNALATHFNGFYPETFVEVYDPPPSNQLLS